MTALARRASLGTILVPLGVVLALTAFLSYSVEWTSTLAAHPRATAYLRRLVRYGLEGSRYVAFVVPALIVLGSLARFVKARGSRGLVFLKLTAYIVLWGAGTFVLFFALFAAYFMGDGHASIDLLVPAALGIAGYALIGFGLVASVLRGAP
jgi:hypothetical protein